LLPVAVTDGWTFCQRERKKWQQNPEKMGDLDPNYPGTPFSLK